MADSKYTAPNDFRAFAESLGETEATLCHHGVKGQKWGVRRFQDKNGRLTAEGRKRYGYGPARKGKHGDAGENENAQDESDRKIAEITKNYEFNREYTLRDPLVKKAISVAKEWDAYRNNELHINEDINRKENLKRSVKTGATIGAGVGIGLGIGATNAINAIDKANTDDYNKRAKELYDESVERRIRLNEEYNESVKRMNDESAKWKHDHGFTTSKEYQEELEYNSKKNNLGTASMIGYYKPADYNPINASVPTTFGAIVGAGAGAGIGAITHGIKEIKATKANHDLKMVIDEIYANKNVDKKTGLKLKNRQMSPDADMAMVNPGYRNWSDGTKSNCAICTATYALRRKGFDVTANGANDGYDTTAFLQAFPKATMRRVQLPRTNKNNELASVINMPEGAYGNMSVSWKNGGGHSMVVSVEAGRVVIRDTQSNKTYRGAAVNKILARTTGEAKVIRLDNADPDIKQMRKMGMITEFGQTIAAPQLYISNLNGKNSVAKTGGKHGDTGVLSDLAGVAANQIGRQIGNKIFDKATETATKGIQTAKTRLKGRGK